MMRQLCEYVGKKYGEHGRRRVISSEDYMIRHYLIFLGQEFDGSDHKRVYPFNAFLHNIRGSDEPFYHDHPWDYTTIILAGGYYEHTPIFDHYGYAIADSVRWYGPGSILNRSCSHFHYLEKGDETTWTLFVRYKRKQEWGFLPMMKKDKVHWKEWTAERKAQGYVR